MLVGGLQVQQMPADATGTLGHKGCPTATSHAWHDHPRLSLSLHPSILSGGEPLANALQLLFPVGYVGLIYP